MPGNEAPEHIHNFFEQDNSSQGHQSQVGGGNWPFLNNPWVGTQTENGIPPTFNSKNYASQSVDTERGNGVQSIQTPLGTNPTRSALKPELIRSQSRNQQINLSGYMHGSQGLQASPIEPDFQEDGTIANSQHNFASRSFSSFEPHHSAPMYSSGLGRSSERPEATEAPVSFDFLGGQQIMRNQHPGLEQSHSINEMKLWQQHLMFKRLQEMQSQQQLQQLPQKGMHHNSLSQFPGIARQGTNDQVPGLLNGMPINNASSFMRSNELMGSELKLPSSSHMFHSANMPWAQRSMSSIQGDPNGLKLSHDQGQVIRSKGLVPQQPDQSLYGTPIASNRGSLAHPSQFQGTAHDFTSTENLAEKALKQSSAFNCFQGGQFSVPTQGYLQDGFSLTNQGTRGKSVFENAPVQSESGGATSGSFQQLNHFSPSVQAQEVEQVGLSPGVASLDPTEGRLLFSGDEGNQRNLFGGSNDRGTGDYLHENPSQSNDYLSAFPSIQSGSWSALMQEAVEASSSDIGLNEEWSGLSLQKMELSSGNHSTVLNANNGKQCAPLGDGIHKNASSLGSTPFPLFNDSEGSPNCHATPTLQTTNFFYQQGEGISSNALHESFQQCSKEPNDNSFDEQKQCVEGSLQMQPQFNNMSNGVWAGRMHEEPASSAHSAEFNHQNTQHLWIQQQEVPLHRVDNHSINKSSAWNVEALPSRVRNAAKTNDNDEKKHHSMNMEREHEGNMLKYGGSRVAASFSNSARGQERVKSDTGSPVMRNEGSYTYNLAATMDSNNLKLSQEADQQLLNRQQSDYGKQVADTFLKNKIEKYQNQRSSCPQAWDSPMGNTDRTSSVTLLKQENSYPKELPNEGFNTSYLVSRQNAERSGAAGKNYFLARNDPHPLGNSSLTSGQDGRGNLGPRRFPFNTMGDSEMSNMEPMSSQHSTSCSQGSSQPGVLGLKNQEQGYAVRTQFHGLAANSACLAANSALDMGKEHLTDLKRNARAAEEIHSSSRFLNQSSMPSPDGATSHFLQNKRSDVTSENMLELLHKVDQSRAENAVTRFGFSAHNAASKMPDADVSDGSSSHLHHNQFALQGISLKLAPPCQRQSLSDCALPLQTALQQTANAFEQRNPDSGLREKVQTLSLSPSSVPSLPPADEASLGKKIGDRSLMPGNRGNDSMNSNSQENSLERSSYTLRMNQSLMHQQQEEQQQQQQISSATGPTASNQSANPPVSKGDAASKQPFHSVKGHKSHMEAIDQSAEASLPSGAGRAPPTRFTPSTDNSASASKFYPVSAGHSQPTMSSSHFRSSGQHSAAVETRTTAQPPGTSAMSQQSGFSNMLHNVWTSVSSQQRVSGMQPQKIISNVLQSMSPLPSSRETNLQKPQRAENHSKRKGENAPSEQGEDRLVKDASSQEMPPPERVSIEPKTGSASRGQETDPKHHSDGTSAVSLSSLGHLHQQDLIRGKHSQVASHDTHKGYDSRPTISSFNHNTGGPYGHSLGSSDVQKQNYSLLQQLQTMKGVDSDPSKRAVKRLKGPDFVSESSQKGWAAGHRYVYGQNTTLREMDTNSQNSSFPTDVRMLSFSSRENDTSVQDDGKEAPSQDQVINKHHDINTHTHPHGKSSPIAFVGGGDRPQISPQMAPSWFEQYGSFKNGQISTTNNVVESLQRSAKAAGQHQFSSFSESMNQDIVPEQRYEASQVGSIRNDTSPSLHHDMSPAPVGASNSLTSPHHPAFEASNNNMVLVPKKRKSATDDFLPWHKEVTEGCQRLQSISVAESDWARATNRLVDKVADEFEMIEDVFPISRTRRRLILTSQLMQQILPSVPAAFLAADVTTSCESVTYFCAKLSLRDACSLVSCSGGDSRLDNGNMGSGKLTTSEEDGENHLAKAAENFIGRSRKLENDFLSLDRRASILDLRLECQELERSSIMNRFAKFHGRAQTEGVESSSATGTVPRRTFPQRHVTALALCTKLPEGVTFLSL
ncbi:uncharacterized protein M6B38_293880 [Iris pallida]|uniref:Uncharacterized protein n=1 Tax=Iris pallida TaxID=29817 RepID=A0AAX6HUP6_IRIPA|nr:uncharacterized protein M6B38_293880 [Iris pallida]